MKGPYIGPLPLSKYIQGHIESEEKDKQTGWQNRITVLKEIMDKAKYIEELAEKGIKDPFEKHRHILDEATCKAAGKDQDPGDKEVGKKYKGGILNPRNWGKLNLFN